MGHPVSPPVEPCPVGHPTLLLAGSLLQHPEARQVLSGVGRGPE